MWHIFLQNLIIFHKDYCKRRPKPVSFFILIITFLLRNHRKEKIMSDKLIECVPNFSEGQNKVIKQITDEIEKVEGAKLLDVDPG